MITAEEARREVANRVTNRPVATMGEIENIIRDAITRFSMSTMTDKRISAADMATLRSAGYTVSEGDHYNPELTHIQWGPEVVPY